MNPPARRADVPPAKGSAVDQAAVFIDKICVRADEHDAAAEILRRYGKQARTYVKAQDLVAWINPDESAGFELTAIRNSIVSDVIQKDMYLPDPKEKLRYYRQQVDTFVTAACGPQKLDSSLMQPPSPASTRGASRRALPCFGERVLPEGDDGGRSSVELVGLGRELRDLD